MHILWFNGGVLKSKQRILIVLAISIGLHAVLLTVYLRQDGAILAGQRHLVGLVSRGIKGFAPVPPVTKPKRSSRQDVVTKQKSMDRPEKIRGNLLSIQQSLKILSVIEQTLIEPIEQVEVIADSIQIVKTSISQESNLPGTLMAVVDSSAEVPPQTSDRTTTDNTNPVTGSLIASISRAVPRYADNPSPAYPEVARRKGWTGEVHLFVSVDESGIVDRLSVRRSSGYSALDRAARQAVRLWRFVPATEGGRRVSSEVVVPINFHLSANDRSEASLLSSP